MGTFLLHYFSIFSQLCRRKRQNNMYKFYIDLLIKISVSYFFKSHFSSLLLILEKNQPRRRFNFHFTLMSKFLGYLIKNGELWIRYFKRHDYPLRAMPMPLSLNSWNTPSHNGFKSAKSLILIGKNQFYSWEPRCSRAEATGSVRYGFSGHRRACRACTEDSDRYAC